MIENIISVTAMLAGIVISILWFVRRSSFSRYGSASVVAASFGLYAIGRLASFLHDIAGVVFEVGVIAIMIVSAIGQFRATRSIP
jgi:EamA domain-containing membrane protein RarD